MAGFDSRWVVGVLMVALSLLGLYIASRGAEVTLYWTGLIFFLVGVLTIFHLIRTAFDEAEGKVKRHRHGVAIVLVVVALGSVLFHLVSPWWWGPIASNWQYIDDTINLTFWITGVVFVAVLLFTAYCVYRFRHRPGNRAAYEPESKRLEWTLTIITGIGVGAMLAPGLFVWDQFIDVPEDAAEVEAVGQQWSWSFRLPGEDGVLGTSDPRNVGPDNPLGLNPSDPNGQDDVIIAGGPLHLPVGMPVKVLLRSHDVLHSFYVPEFRTKMDLVPGMITQLWFTPTRTGTFQILCAELCGVAHAYMRSEVVVVEEADYLAWLGEQQTFARLAAAARDGSLASLASGDGSPAP
ncbi:MAG: cytochrome c oxidase subunit II [Alphaproteobacteria bacterium]